MVSINTNIKLVELDNLIAELNFSVVELDFSIVEPDFGSKTGILDSRIIIKG